MRRQQGLSLVELMISITLGIVLMAGVVQIFLSSKAVFSTQQGISRIQEAGRLAIDFMARDIRMAAYYGCVRPDKLQNDTLAVAGLHEKFGEPVRGYQTAALLPHGPAVDLGASVTPIVVDANVLVIRSANEVGFPISAPNTSTSVFGYVPDGTVLDSGCVNGFCNGSVVVVSDCFKARLMTVSGLSLSGNTLMLDHPDSWGGGANAKQNFTTGELLKMNTVVYFLAQGAGGQPSLWQRTNTDSALELIEGVEKMRITYARTDNSSYVMASSILTVAEWAKVNSIRVELVVRSIDDNVLERPQPYTFAGVEIIPTDRRMRQVFTSTIGIRNRATLN